MENEIQMYFNGLQVNIYKDGKNIWFKGKDIALILGYKNPSNAVMRHVPEKDRKKVTYKADTQNGYVVSTITFINEPGVYRLVFRSKLKEAEEFQDWVFTYVLPSIRKTGEYITPLGNQILLKNKNDLHFQVIKYIRKYHPDAIIIPGLGENQDTGNKRIKSWQKGYIAGQPDIIIGNLHMKYNGLAIELKTPNGKGKLNNKQKLFLKNLRDNNFLVVTSDDYDFIHRCIDKYFTGVRVKCYYCKRKFKGKKTLKNHLRYFHRLRDFHSEK